MALNLKAALGICLFFIAGLCYVVNRVALPSQAAASQGTALADGGTAKPNEPSSFGARRLARQTPVEAQRAASRQAAKPAADSMPPETRTVSLPPVAHAGAPQNPSGLLVAQAAPQVEPPIRVSEPTGVQTPALGATTAVEQTGASAPEQPLAQARLASPTAGEGAKAAPAGEASGGNPKPEPAVASTYKVQKGDSLARVAQQVFGSSDQRYVRMLIEANPKIAKRTNKLFVGENLTVPSLAAASSSGPKGGAAKRTKPAAPAEQPAATVDAAGSKSAKPGHKAGASDKPVAEAAPPKSAKSEHKSAAAANKQAKAAAKAGAEKAGTTVAAAPAAKRSAGGARSAKAAVKAGAETEANKGAKPGKKSGKGGSSAETAAGQWYTIRGSDSLASIARDVLKDGRRWRELADVNGLRDPNKILRGKRIKLPSGTQRPG